MKKIISAALAAIMSLSIAAAVTAEGDTPKVYIDDAQIIFSDQEPVIVNDRTLVPARGVFQAMGARVDWDGERRVVQINSEDNLTRIYLTIDNPVMEVYKFTSMFASDKSEVTLDVAPQILNDRTMIPLRAISETMNCEVDWDKDTYSVLINTAGNAVSSDNKTAMFLTASAKEVKEGETVDVFVNVKNLPEKSYVTTVSALMEYNKDAFEFVDSVMFHDGEEIESAIGASNPDYEDGMIKTALITVNDAIKTDGTVAKLTFKAKKDAAAEFNLTTSYDVLRGFNTSLSIDIDGYSESIEGSDLALVPGVTEDNAPDATAVPDVTASPDATTIPAATLTPASTASPDATVSPDATASPAASAEPTEAPKA